MSRMFLVFVLWTVSFAPNAAAQARPILSPLGGPEPARVALPTPPLRPLVRDVLPHAMQGAEALAALRADVLAVVATQNGRSIEAFTRLLATDPSAWLDADGRLLFIDPPRSIGNLTLLPAAPAPFPISQTFQLHSRPGSNRVLYLDFDGYELPAGTGWHGGLAYSALPYDTNGDGATWSQDEHDVIQSVWQRVAEDYAPFDVDVTTEDPGYDAINRSDGMDDVYGGRVVITNSPMLDICSEPCGGVSYVGNVDEVGGGHDYYQPSWTFTEGVGPEPKPVTEATTHEFGHAMGLGHDGQTPSTGYYGGHGMWAPIMGVGYYLPVTQWSKGEYTNPSNTEDDFSVAVSNGVALVADETGGGLGTTNDLVPGERRLVGATPAGDIDTWRYVAPCSGTYTFTAHVAPVSPNLSLEFQLYGPGNLFLAGDNLQPVAVDGDIASGMGGTITYALTGGATYVLGVLPLANETPSTGWSNYGNVGRYSIDVSPPCSNCRFATSVVDFSSQYTPTDWSAQQALGPPDVYPRYGDIEQAWASATGDDPEFLTLGFADPAPINFVNVYETFAPGAIASISAKNPNTGAFEVVWTGAAAAAPTESRLFTAVFPETPFSVSEIRINLDSPAVPDWNEIDAVSIGKSDLVAQSQWGQSVAGFSSQYGPTDWSAQQALGPPNLYPLYADDIRAWASETQDGQREFLEIEYATPAAINFVHVVETWNPGALDKVLVKNPNTNTFEEVWSGTAAPAPPAARIRTVSFPETRFLVSQVRLEFDSPAVPDWNEVDAVGIGRCACQATLVDVPAAAMPVTGRVEQARPNPFTRSTDLGFALPRGGAVTVDVFNVTGQRVRRLVDRTLPAGRHVVRWDGRDANGRALASGVYYLRVRTAGVLEGRKVVKIE